MLCVNPMSWVDSGEPAPPSAHPGSLPSVWIGKPVASIGSLSLGASCGPDGVLHLSYSPKGSWRNLVFSDDDYHVHDINLFWANLRENAERRAREFPATDDRRVSGAAVSGGGPGHRSKAPPLEWR
jgi:hypothetical protein